MPRWLVLLLIALGAGSWWLAHRNSAPLAATIGGNGANDACRALQSPARLDDALQTVQIAVPFRAGNAQLTPLAGFSVDARVLSREDYHYGRESEFSPTDLALGWGPMSAPGLAEKLEISQGGRWYRYHWGGDGPPLAPAEISSHSANMHMVPASQEVAQALSRVHAEDKIRLDGWLLRIDGDEGWHWQSSMSRDDAGAGACELVLVCRIGPG